MDKVVLGNAELWNGDCLEVMTKLKPMSVDAVLTDPPYMIGAISTGNAKAKSGGRTIKTGNVRDRIDDICKPCSKEIIA